MRFLLKSAFWLGLLAFLLPGGAASDGDDISIFSAMIGAQAAFQDLAGFCERSPSACETGRDLAAFAGARVSDGMVLAYGLLGSNLPGGDPAPAGPDTPDAAMAVAAPVVPATVTDPVQTGSLVGTGRHAAADRPVRAAGHAAAAVPSPDVAPGAIPLPRPAPRA